MNERSTPALELLFARLDPDPARAGERYEILRLKLIKTVEWKGCPASDADTVADLTIDRVAEKIAAGEQIANVEAYACTVLRFVWLEWVRANPPRSGLDEIGDPPDQMSWTEDEDDRMPCLRRCLAEVVPVAAEKEIIASYYDPDPGLKNKEHRKQLAEKLGLTMTTLKVKACRLRARLEKCINACMKKRSVTKPA